MGDTGIQSQRRRSEYSRKARAYPGEKSMPAKVQSECLFLSCPK